MLNRGRGGCGQAHFIKVSLAHHLPRAATYIAITSATATATAFATAGATATAIRDQGGTRGTTTAADPNASTARTASTVIRGKGKTRRITTPATTAATAVTTTAAIATRTQPKHFPSWLRRPPAPNGAPASVTETKWIVPRFCAVGGFVPETR